MLFGFNSRQKKNNNRPAEDVGIEMQPQEHREAEEEERNVMLPRDD